MCWLTSTTFSGVPNRECTKFARSWYHWSYFVCCSTCTLTIKQFKEKSAVDFKNNVGWGLKWSTCQMFGLIFLLSRVWAQREDHTSNRGDLWLVRCLVSLISSLVFILWKFDQSNEFFSMVILGCTRLFYSWVNFIGIEILILKKKKKTETTAYNMVRKTEATAYNMVVKKKKKIYSWILLGAGIPQLYGSYFIDFNGSLWQEILCCLYHLILHLKLHGIVLFRSLYLGRSWVKLISLFN